MQRPRITRRLKPLRQQLEGLVARGASRVIPRLSRRAVVRLSHVLAYLAYGIAVRDRRIASANLAVAFGASLAHAERRRMVIGSFQSFALMALDTFWLARDTRARMAAIIRISPAVRDAVRQRPLICVTGHFGNWDLFGTALAAAGIPLSSVAMPQQNPYIDRLLNARREATGMRVIARDGALRALLRELRQNRCVALLLDQNTRPEEGGVFLPFCGVPVPVSPVADVLCRRTGAPVYMAWCIPDAKGIYHTHSGRLLTEVADENDPYAMTRLILDEIEAAVRRYPHYWLWAYRRWRYIPSGTGTEAYPFYATRYRSRTAALSAPGSTGDTGAAGSA